MNEMIYNLLMALGWVLAVLFGIDNWYLRRKIKRLEDKIEQLERQRNLDRIAANRQEVMNHLAFAHMYQKLDSKLTSSAAAEKVEAMFARFDKETPKPDADETHN